MPTTTLRRSPPLLLAILSASLALAQQPLQQAQVEAIAQRAFAAFQPKGMALAVVQDGKLLAELGLGERRAGSPVTARTLFNIASCSKAFTAALVGQLVREGKLGWNDRVVDRVPEFRMADAWITAHLTIADLLSHRCGLVTFAGDLLWYDSDYDDSQVLARIEKLPITQRFREQFGYQNLMYLVAGIALQRATGSAWEDLVETRILKPLGMQDSRACAQRLPADAERAFPHIDGIEVPDHEFVACRPAAAIYSSVHDLSLWIACLLAGGKPDGAVDEAMLGELWRPHVAMGGGTGGKPGDLRGYGMGWFLSLQDGKKLVEHDGGMPGFLSKVSLLPADKFGFVVLNNANDGVLNEASKAALLAAHAGGDADAAIDRFAKINERVKTRAVSAVQKREAARIAGTNPSLPLTAYAGRYEDAVYGPAEVRLDGDQLHVVLLPGKRRLFGAMSHWHRDVFRVDFPDRFLPFALFQFALDVDGKVKGFTIDCPIADFDFGALDFRRTGSAN
jgi:CubicO group peptidase (beta-lactamase class C family)